MGESADGVNGNAASGRGTAGASRTAPGDAERAVTRARHAAREVHDAAAQEAARAGLARELFARPVRDYAIQVLDRPIALLRAGCRAPLYELDLIGLRESGFEVAVTTVDQDHPLTRDAAAGRMTGPDRGEPPAAVSKPVLGDLRTIPLPPRSFDIVYCAALLEHIALAPLVLDRFVAALRPGGLILLRLRDRYCASAALDRLLPEAARRALWARLHPAEPGPFPAVYDPLASERGIQAYASLHGLVIARREAVRTPHGRPGRLAGAVSAACAVIAWLSRGRRTNAHDELLYVIRKPEDRFARLL